MTPPLLRSAWRRAALTTAALLAVSTVGVLPAAAGLVSAAPTASPASTPTATVEVDLDGDDWAFSLGDDPTWSDPSFDDSAWVRTAVPSDGAPFADYDGFGWYRLTFDLPAEAEGANLVASLGFLDDVDEAFLNGQRIGGSGDMPPNASSQWFEKRLYPVPAATPVFGGSNLLAVRVTSPWLPMPTLVPA